jgi:hypothetical protein
MNKIIIGIFIFVVIFFFITMTESIPSLNTLFDTKNSAVKSLGNYSCNSTPANNKIVGDSFCVGKKTIFGLKDTCSVKVQNLENQPADFSVSFKCFTVESPSPVTIESNKNALSGGDIGTFTVKYGSKNREWRCEVSSVNSSKVNNCYRK